MKNFSWKIRRQYYNLLVKGIKTLEVKVGYFDIKRVLVGDTITFPTFSDIKFEVIRISRYANFTETFDNEDISKANPDLNKDQALHFYKDFYSAKKESLGVYVFELRKQSSNVK